MTSQDHDAGARVAERVERRWASLSVALIVIFAVLTAFAGIHQATMPQGRVETAAPATIHMTGEFIESNLGSAVEPDGSITLRAIGQQYSFTPQYIPTDTPITFRATTPDVIQGFLIQGTNINTMLIPGYISQIPSRFSTPGDRLMPCQEFWGVGHEGVRAKVKVVDKADFTPTLVAMGFGYAITESSRNQPLVGRRWAWAGFSLIVVGAIMAMIPVAFGRASAR